MAKARRLRIGIARTPTKHREKEIISKAKYVEEHPELIIPRCSPEHCGRGHFTKTLKTIEKVRKVKDNEMALKKFSRKGDKLARAFAVSLLLARSEKIPQLAAARLPQGEIYYAVRGMTDKEKLIAVQHYDKPELRMLGVVDLVKKKGLHIYSDKKGMYCTGRAADPPVEFVNWAIKQIKGLPAAGVCQHITEDVARDRGPATNGEPYFRLHWRSADRFIAVCQRCAGERHSFAELARYMVAPDVKSDFEAEAVIRLEAAPGTDEENIERFYGKDEESEEEYLSGKLSDSALIKRHQEALDRRILDSGERVIVLDNRFYGENCTAFAEALTDDPLERSALEAALDRFEEPIVAHDTSAGKIMGMLWENCAFDMLMAAAEDKEIARMVMDDADLSRDAPAKLIRDAEHLARHSRILARLPAYGKLPRAASLADRLARIYLTEEVDDVVRELEKHLAPETNAIAYAFLARMGKEAGWEWHFTKEQMDFGKVLVDHVSALLEARSADGYHEALEALHRAAGGTDDLERQG